MESWPGVRRESPEAQEGHRTPAWVALSPCNRAWSTSREGAASLDMDSAEGTTSTRTLGQNSLINLDYNGDRASNAPCALGILGFSSPS